MVRERSSGGEPPNEAPDWRGDLELANVEPYFRTQWGSAYPMDAMDLLRALPDESVDLVLTSPPYPLYRPKEYGNVAPERYIDWFLPFCRQICCVLKPTGSFVLEIGGAWLPEQPVRSTVPFELVTRIAELMPLAQDFYWHNPAKLPLSFWVNNARCRVKDAVNLVLWFSKTADPKADNRRVLQPYSKDVRRRIEQRAPQKRRSPSGHRITPGFIRNNGGAIPTNLLTLTVGRRNDPYVRACRKHGITPHPARFPKELVEFFVEFLTDVGDLVVDPFAGSLVTGTVCERRQRYWCGSDAQEEYLRGGQLRFGERG